MFDRFIVHKIYEALTDTPVVMIAGPRQCGKTTLVKHLLAKDYLYVTLDDAAQLEIALNDPIGFIRNFSSQRVILDEVQRAPELFVSIKQSIDELRLPGRFVLTGSANALLLPQVSDSLAGRMEVIHLFPFSETEILNKKNTFLSKIFSQIAPNSNEVRVRSLLMEKIIAGGYPEALSRHSESRRAAWYLQYINSLIHKDLLEIGRIEHVRVMPHFLKVLASHSGQLVNFTRIGEMSEISRHTALKYLQLLEQLYLVEELPSWQRNENKQLTKTNKLHFLDTGLLCALRNINKNKLEKDLILFGHLLEGYVFSELKKQVSWFEDAIRIFHYRDKNKIEVDFVLEGPGGNIIGIEVKATAMLRKNDFKGLEQLQQMAGNDFLIGILLYDGDHTAAFGENLYAVPISVIWN